MTLARSQLEQEMPPAQYEAVKAETLDLLNRRLEKVQSMRSVLSKDVNINPFLMLAMAPAYNIYSPLEAASYAQMTKLPHGDATAFGRFVEDRIFPHFGVTDPPEKVQEKDLWSSIDKAIVVEGRRYLMTLKSGPWTMNQSHANEMVAAFPEVHRRFGADVVIGIYYGAPGRVNNKPKYVQDRTGDYVHVLVGQQLWEFVTGVKDAHLKVLDAIQDAQKDFALDHGGKTFAEHLIEAQLQLAESYRTEFGVVESGDAMWQQIFRNSF